MRKNALVEVGLEGEDLSFSVKKKAVPRKKSASGEIEKQVLENKAKVRKNNWLFLNRLLYNRSTEYPCETGVENGVRLMGRD